MVSEEARAEIARMFAKRKDTAERFPQGKPLDVNRREWEAEELAKPLPEGTSYYSADIGGMRAEWVETLGVTEGRVFLLLHGGGYNAGSPITHRRFAALLSAAAGLPVLMPDYRLAPEHPFPAALEDALAAYRYLQAEGYANGDIIVGGDSAGGGLTLSLLLALREQGSPMPRAAVLLSPWTDLSVSSDTYESLRERDPIITREGLGDAGRWYAASRDIRHPVASPLFADLSGLPPLLVHAGSDEVMLDDSRLLAERAKTAGVKVSFTVYEGMWHVHHHGAPEVPESVQAMNDVATFLRAEFGD